MDPLEQKIIELARKGDIDKLKWYQNIDKAILPNHVRRIQQNDKTVIQELVLPKWVSWELIHNWAMSKNTEKGRICILCNERNSVGIDFKEKFICDNCFVRLKMQ